MNLKKKSQNFTYIQAFVSNQLNPVYSQFTDEFKVLLLFSVNGQPISGLYSFEQQPQLAKLHKWLRRF